MRNRKTYEWRVNQVDEHGDINDIYFFDTYAEAANFMCLEGFQNIELTKIIGNDDDGIVDRTYATVDFDLWELPEAFDDGSKIPANKRAEVRKWHKADFPVICKSKEAVSDAMAPHLVSGLYKVEKKFNKDHEGKVYMTSNQYIHVPTGLCVAFSDSWVNSDEGYTARIHHRVAREIFSAL